MPDDTEPVRRTPEPPPTNPWAVEHYGFTHEAAPPATGPVAPVRPVGPALAAPVGPAGPVRPGVTRRPRTRTALVGGVLAGAVLAATGGFAAAQAAGDDRPDRAGLTDLGRGQQGGAAPGVVDGGRGRDGRR